MRSSSTFSLFSQRSAARVQLFAPRFTERNVTCFPNLPFNQENLTRTTLRKHEAFWISIGFLGCCKAPRAVPRAKIERLATDCPFSLNGRRRRSESVKKIFHHALPSEKIRTAGTYSAITRSSEAPFGLKPSIGQRRFSYDFQTRPQHMRKSI